MAEQAIQKVGGFDKDGVLQDKQLLATAYLMGAIDYDVLANMFDDIAISQYLSPALTTVRVDAYELGEVAVHQLLPLTRALKPMAPHHEVLPTTLVVRESCGSSHPHPVDMRSRRRRSQVFSAPPEATT